MGWQDRNVYFRDFAYTAKRRARMATGNISEVPANVFAELLSGPMLDVYVGASKRHWSLHRNLLLHHSERLENELHESDGKKVHTLQLPDYDPSGFELLVKWLYQGRLDDVSDMADANQKYEYAVNCHKLYLLCDRFDMPQLKNVAMDQYRKGLNEAQLVPDAEEIDEIYHKSPNSSPFRRLMARIAARQIMDPDNDRDVETYRQCFDNNPDFAIDLVKAIKHGAGGILFIDPTDNGNACEYHDHEAGPNCHIKGKGKSKQGFSSSPNRSPTRPQLRQIGSIRKLRPSPPPSPPDSSPAESPVSSPAASSPASSPGSPGSPTRRHKRRPSPPSPHQSGFFNSRDADRNSDSSPYKSKGAARQVSSSEFPRATPNKYAAPTQGDDGVTPSSRRPPPKLRRYASPAPA